MTRTDLVTGAFGYSGTYISRRLLQMDHGVRTLTNHPRQHPGISTYPYTFDDPDALTAAFTGVDTFYNTYWSRYAHGGTDHQQAVRNSRALIDAAVRAGVRRIVHLSITNPDPDSFYAYYRGKASVEDYIRASGPSYAIVRPTVIFGPDDILMNNIAWLLRRFPVFAVPGDGTYRLRPVAVTDLAALCTRLGDLDVNTTVDAVGPETFTFIELVDAIAKAIGARSRILTMPPAMVSAISRGLSRVLRDVVLTRDELDGLMAELVHVDGPATCPTRVSDYLRDNADRIGREYASELARRRPEPVTPPADATASASVGQGEA
jgi:NADH dehydrogenase